MVKVAWITLNRNCNLKCDWCYAKESSKKGSMDYKKLVSLISNLSLQGIEKIILIGGEPLLYPKIYEICNLIKDYNINQSITTNGILLANMKTCESLVASGLKAYNMSLKGVSSEEYCRTSCKNGLEYFITAYKNLKKLNIEPLVSYVIIDDSKEKLEKLITLLEENDMNNIAFQFVKPVLKFDTNHNNMMKLDKMGKFCEYLFKRMLKTNINFSIEVSFPLCLIDRRILEDMLEKKVINTCCHIQKGTALVLDTDFKVLPCNHFVNYPFDIKSVDVDSQNFISNAFSEREVIEFRNKVSCYPSYNCKSCNLWNYCGGGCFTRWLYEVPSDYIK